MTLRAEETTQLTFSSTNNREFEQIPLNWSLTLPLNCTSLREIRKRPQSGIVKALSVAVNTFSGDVTPQLSTVISLKLISLRSLAYTEIEK